jgi:streptogramin lyase
VVLIDPVTGDVADAIEVGSGPAAVTNADAGQLWVRNEGGTSVTEVRTDPPAAGRTIELNGRPVGTAVTATAVWFAVDDGSLERLDRTDGRTRTVGLGCAPVGLSAVADGSAAGTPLDGVWVVCDDGALLHVRDAG